MSRKFQTVNARNRLGCSSRAECKRDVDEILNLKLDMCVAESVY